MKQKLCVFLTVGIVSSLIPEASLLENEASPGLADVNGESSLRVKRQAQALLTVLQQNPALLQQLQQNPALIQTLQNRLAQQSQKLSVPLGNPLLSGNGQLISTVDDGSCSALRKQNKLLRQMLLSITDEDDLSKNPRDLLLAATTNPAQDLLERAVGGGPNQNSESFSSVLVTPTPTWSTIESTTAYETIVTQTASTEVPIILRGKKVITTILEESVQTVTATEILTSSTLITPSPTWSTFAVTVTPSVNLLQDTFGLTSIDHEDFRPKKRNNQIVEAKVIEIDETTEKISKLDRFREAYGAYFASSAQRSAQRFGDSFKRLGGEIDEEIFDQEVQPAVNRPVYVPSPSQAQTHKQFTLYYSGSLPGEIVSKVTVLPVDANGKPLRTKREAIQPSSVEPILQTSMQGPPSDPEETSVQGSLEDLQSSMEPCIAGHTITSTVTIFVTDTVLLPK